jgi:membrane protein
LKLRAWAEAPAEFGLHCLRRFIDMEGTLQATVLAAQAFTSLIPFLVVASAFAPGESDVSDRIVERFSLDGDAARSVEALFNDKAEVESTVTWISVVILVLATLSFTRAMQRTFQRAYGVEPGRWTDMWRGLAWLAGFALWIAASSLLNDWLRDVGGLVLALGVATLLGFVLWLWTPAILLGNVEWRRLAPGAAVSAFLAALLSLASAIYVPVLMEWSADKYGLIGVAFSMQSWLLAVSFVVVIGAVVGAVVNEHFGDRLGRSPAAGDAVSLAATGASGPRMQGDQHDR